MRTRALLLGRLAKGRVAGRGEDNREWFTLKKDAEKRFRDLRDRVLAGDLVLRFDEVEWGCLTVDPTVDGILRLLRSRAFARTTSFGRWVPNCTEQAKIRLMRQGAERRAAHWYWEGERLGADPIQAERNLSRVQRGDEPLDDLG